MYTGHVRISALLHISGSINPPRAHFVYAHPALRQRSTSLASGKFSGFTNGDYLRVVFRFSRSARHIMHVQKVEFTPESGYENRIDEFCSRFSEELIYGARQLSIAYPEFEDVSAKFIADVQSRARIAANPASPEKPHDDPASEPEPEVELPAGVLFDGKNEGYWLGSVFVSKEHYTLCDLAFKVAKTMNPVNLLMTGPSGCGKTSIPEEFARIFGMNFIRMNCAQVRDPEEWFGYREARDGSTVFVPSEFTQAVTAGNCVVVLDEFNRVEPWLHNTLYPLLDHARKTSIHGELIECGPNVVFFATANLGFQYVGTFQLDAAITNRMDMTISVSFLPAPIEQELLVKRYAISPAEASKIAKIMGKLRGLATDGRLSADVSTRTALKIAMFLSVKGAALNDVFKAVLFNALPDAEKKIVSDVIASMI